MGGGEDSTQKADLTAPESKKALSTQISIGKTGKSNTQLVAAALPGMPGMMQFYNLVIPGYLLRQALLHLPGFMILLIQDPKS